MPVIELKTEEALFRNDMVRNEHFMIDCACGGTDGQYHGHHIKGTLRRFESEIKGYAPLTGNRAEHTFYFSGDRLLTMLYNHHSEDAKQDPFIIVCNDCSREFEFTHESYLDLRMDMMKEYNRKIMAEESKK